MSERQDETAALVERLRKRRDVIGIDADCSEAADTIERFKRELTTLKSGLDLPSAIVESSIAQAYERAAKVADDLWVSTTTVTSSLRQISNPTFVRHEEMVSYSRDVASAIRALAKENGR